MPQGTLPLVTGLVGALVPSGFVLPLAPALPVAAPTPGKLASVLMVAAPPLPLLLDPQALTKQATNNADIDTPEQSRSTFI